MIKVELKEYKVGYKLSYHLNFLDVVSEIKIGDQCLKLPVNPVINIALSKGSENSPLLLIIDVENNIVVNSDPILDNLIFTETMSNVHYKNTLKETILSHFKGISNDNYVLESYINKKWKDVDIEDFTKKFGESYINTVLNTKLNHNKILKSTDFEQIWHPYIQMKILERDIPQTVKNSKALKF